MEDPMMRPSTKVIADSAARLKTCVGQWPSFCIQERTERIVCICPKKVQFGKNCSFSIPETISARARPEKSGKTLKI
jgi:hypothetical protein